ncbi:type II toxin-antitoxin system RelE/ParE family toxin [Arthrobacter sp. PAMC 25486]|uniref:type II toxin-antitoxin system RelE family toxin n=1 Tax=Arthrobacter sp. PAMC 25486 TaxID=1494608 RepID=UPI00056DD5AB|nr:type II toxin-antitoxin system RelE/ParE family toxin [Arthrobacter sp. PAMC 25486]
MSEKYEVELTSAARKQLQKLDGRTRELILGSLGMLAEMPRPPAASNLSGRPGQFRIRVRDFHIIYSVDDGRLLMLVIKIGQRRDVHK